MRFRGKVVLIFSLFLSAFLLFAQARAQSKTPEIKAEKAVQEKANEAKAQKEAVNKEAEIQSKSLELEKKKAALKVQEVETAKKEAVIIKETSKDKQEIQEAVKAVGQKEKEAQAAVDKVKVAEEKLLAAQEAARLAEEELALVQERADAAEAKIKQKQNLIYKKLLQTGLIIFIGYLLIFIAVSIVNRRIENIKVKHVVRKNVVYLLNFLIIIFVIFVWLQNISSITIFFSVMGAGIALALQEVILCAAGWVLILMRRPFEAGDRVELGGVKGDIIDIRLFQTSLLEIGNWVDADQSTGRIVNIPNSAVFKKENYNYNQGFEFIWNEIKILVTFESDWKKAEEIINKHGKKEAEGMESIVKRKIKNMTKRYMIYYEKLTPIVYANIKDSGVELTLRYLTEARMRRATQDRLCRAILDDFEKEEKVSFAYPTYRIIK
ncbi:MAG: mechanosensitive ion channel domain-containing protein [Candidatus Omnitrophota bacterium]